MKFSARIQSIGPRSVLLLVTLLAVVAALTLLTEEEMNAQGGSSETLTRPTLTASAREGNVIELS